MMKFSWTVLLLSNALHFRAMIVEAQPANDDCCLCDDCNVDLQGNAVGVDEGDSTLVTDCGDLASRLLLYAKATDEECMRKKYIYSQVCCPTSAAEAAVVVDDNPQTSLVGTNKKKKKKKTLRFLQWSYPSWGSSQQTSPFLGFPAPAPVPVSTNWWSFSPPGPSVVNWFPAPAPRPVYTAPRPVPSTNWGYSNPVPNWGNSNPSYPNGSTTTTTTSSSAQDWVNAHNTRRSQYHQQNGVSYIAVKWSEDLAGSARSYTQRLLNGLSGCQIQHKFQGDSYGGENLAMQITGSTTSISPEAVLRMWYEGEMGLPYPQNGHLTQVVWRGTKYIGCATLTKSLDGQTCHIQTCRYMAPGNCNGVGSILQDSTSCAPQCPREGCF